MTLDLDQLESLAKAATPGPWRVGAYPAEIVGDTHVCINTDIGVKVLLRGNENFYEEARADAAFSAAANPAAILELCAEARALREDAAMFRLLTWTCDALDANSFDASNQPGTIRMTLRHKTRTYPELEMKIIDFLLGYKARVEAAEKEPT